MKRRPKLPPTSVIRQCQLNQASSSRSDSRIWFQFIQCQEQNHATDIGEGLNAISFQKVKKP